MAEQVVRVFDARCSMSKEYSVVKPCVLFFTGNRIVAGIIEGISSKLVVAVVIAAAVTFIGLFLKDLILFLGGLVAVVVVSSVLAVTDYIVRHRRRIKVKRLVLDEVLRANKRNFEVFYSDIVKAKHGTFERFEWGMRFLIPTLPELMHDIELVTSQGRYVFILERNDLNRCMDLLNQFVPEKIEKDEDEEF